MGTCGFRCALIAGFSLIFAECSRSDTPATLDDLLKQHNLSKMGFYLVLPNETDVHSDVRDLRAAKNQIGQEAQSQDNADRAVKRCQDELDSEQSQFLDANQALAAAAQKSKTIPKKDFVRYNQQVDEMNLDQARVNEMSVAINRTGKQLDDLKTKAAQSDSARSKYINLTMDVAARAESVAKAYDDLVADDSMKSALASYNASNPKPLKFGPSGVFQDDLKFIRACEKDVVTAPIEVEKSSGVSHVTAILNGSVVDSMVWDSGASTVLLSAATAERLKLKPGVNAPTATLSVADGRTVKARLMTLQSVRVGGFLVKNVDCAILPPGAGGSDDLLGNTFQKHFISRLDQQTGQLLLTPHDDSVVVGTEAKPLDQLAKENGPTTAPTNTNTAPSSTSGAKPISKPSTKPDATADAGKDLFGTLQGDTQNTVDGAIVLENKDRIKTADRFQPPVKFTIVAKIDTTNLRLAYAAKSITFNWERDANLLRITGGPADAHNTAGAGHIATGEWATVELTVLPNLMKISVNGEQRFTFAGDFSNVNDPLQIFTYKAKIAVKSVKVSIPIP